MSFRRLKTLLKLLWFKIRFPKVPFSRPGRSLGTLYGQDGQELVLLPLMLKEFDKGLVTIVDVGANHPTKFSNSFLFEKYFGARVFAVEPLEEFRMLWELHRPSATFVAAAATDFDGELEISTPVGGDSMFSKIGEANNKALFNGRWERRKICGLTLNTILTEHKVVSVTLLLIDVEGFEFQVLKGIDLKKYNVSLILLENNEDGYFGQDDIRRYLIDQGFSYSMRIGTLDDLFVRQSVFNDRP